MAIYRILISLGSMPICLRWHLRSFIYKDQASNLNKKKNRDLNFLLQRRRIQKGLFLNTFPLGSTVNKTVVLVISDYSFLYFNSSCILCHSHKVLFLAFAHVPEHVSTSTLGVVQCTSSSLPS